MSIFREVIENPSVIRGERGKKTYIKILSAKSFLCPEVSEEHSHLLGLENEKERRAHTGKVKARTNACKAQPYTQRRPHTNTDVSPSK